jgi:polysaccharide deacetylase 2 family uncharacterized protein YibQ
MMSKKMRRSKSRRRKKRSVLPKIFAVLCIVFFITVLLSFVLSLEFPGNTFKSDKVAAQKRLRASIENSLKSYGIEKKWLLRKNNELHVRVPADLHPLTIYQKLSQVIIKKGGEISHGKADKSGRMSLAYQFDGKRVETIKLMPDTSLLRTNAKIALIIDDFGYHDNQLIKAFLDLPFAATYAIIPGLEYSKKLATELGKQSKAVMIHIPMEPMQGRVESGEYTLLTGLSAEEIGKRMQKAMADVPFAIGVNNHMGSKATTDSVLLSAVFTEMQKNGYFYVDSRTSSESIAYDIARSLGVPALRNNIFLDPVDEQETIEKKLFALAEMAKNTGQAIGIGHPRPNTLAALRKVVPELQTRGYIFVPVNSFLKAVLSMKN